MSVDKKKEKVIGESIMTFLFFLVLGIVLWQTKHHIFYLFNFAYIGLAAALGELLFGLLPREQKYRGRRISQLLIGIYLLGVLGFLGRENMQIEGFFFYLLAGSLTGALLHYLIAKIGGTVLFGRGWCGWACWTAMVLDLLPWSQPRQGRLRHWGSLRYLHFFLSLSLVLVLWHFHQLRDFHRNSLVELNWLLIGNLLYFSTGIILATLLQDNRAFCKYLCPIPVLMKIGARFSLWKIEIDSEKCTRCGLCELNCPMNIRLLSYLEKGQRITSTECIACQQCVNICPELAISYTRQLDAGCREYLNFRNKYDK